MDNETVLVEVESVVEAIEQVLSAVIGTLGEVANPKSVLIHFLTARDTLNQAFGENGWRDRMMSMSVRTAALKARLAFPDDESVQTLTATLLADPQGRHAH